MEKKSFGGGRKHMHEWMRHVACYKCTYLGEYDDILDEKKHYMSNMLMRYRESFLSLKKDNVTYNIKIVLTANRKKIEIEATTTSTINALLNIVQDVLRFENLFEGLFFPLISFEADGKDYTAKVRKAQLSYYNSQKRYMYMPINFDDRRYKKLFTKWISVERKNKIIHPVFLYSTYLNGMPVDIRMAMLLETFEPIAEDLHNREIITLVKPPTKTYTNSCKNCGGTVSRVVPNKELEFKDKLKPLLKKYGGTIFKGDSKAKLISKSVKIRNKVDHVRANTENALNGRQCGYYIYKFSLMYRYIMLQEIGILAEEIESLIIQYVEHFNEQYPQLRV